MPKPGAKPKRSRNRRGDEQRQWAAAVVQKATPKIVESLIEAAGSLGESAPAFPTKPPKRESEEVEDESLAALLLRLLRAPETGESSDARGNAMTAASENPSVG